MMEQTEIMEQTEALGGRFVPFIPFVPSSLF